MRNANLRHEREAQDVRNYATKYNCTITEAFYDVMTDEPFTIEWAEAVAAILGVEVSKEIRRRATSAHAVNSYYSEIYDI